MRSTQPESFGRRAIVATVAGGGLRWGRGLGLIGAMVLCGGALAYANPSSLDAIHAADADSRDATQPSTHLTVASHAKLEPTEAEAPVAPPPQEETSTADLEDDPLPRASDEVKAAREAALPPEFRLLDAPRWIRHHRAPRETLGQVATRHGVSEFKLREWNGLSASDPAPHRRKRLRVWARRLPPPRERIDYTVQEGDTWWSVALRHGVDGRDIRAYNWPARKKMRPGAMLQIWIDPVVHAWIADGPDPLPPDLDRGFRRGAISIGSPNEGVLVNGLRIPTTDRITLRIPRSAYGTSHAIEQLLLACNRFLEHTDYPLNIPFGSMSRPRGGPIGGHLSHQSGRDIDIKLLRRPDVAAWREIRGSRVHWPAVWELVRELVAVDVQVIFLDARARRRLFRAAAASGATPEEISHARRIVRHSPGHEHHLHVRFGCGPFEPECIP